MTALLSVVMPTHDRAREVVRAATSVLSQDVDAMELVIVDDSSTADSVEVLDRLAREDPRVRIVRTAGSVGPCVARNEGLEVARGELVAFCDDDDAWFPGVGRVLLDFLDAHPDVVAASSWHVVHHADGGGAAVFRGPLEFGSRQLLWQNFVALPFAVVRRAALSFDVRFDPDLPTGEDWDLWLRCSREGLVRTVPHVGYLYTQHGGSRVTRAVEAQVTGRRNFVAKHGATMTGACRLYHETVLAGYEQGRGAMVRSLGPGGGRSVRDVTSVGFLLASNFVASRAGQRRRDPGLQARLMASLLARGRT
ncbi:MAG TPA: glycosyltransferase family 2 protein [Acidimicrobiales bacterium]|nr:glycosyltransferase family 2 protein [Acidimicrobiales bacterium]